MSVVVSAEQQSQRKMLKAAVEALKREYKRRSTAIREKLHPVVPRLYTKGAVGKEELHGDPRYWSHEHGASDEQHDLWGWRILDALQKARTALARARLAIAARCAPPPAALRRPCDGAATMAGRQPRA